MLRRDVYRPLFGLALVAAVPTPAEGIDVFILEVHGLVWEECRHSVEEALRDIKDVVDVQVDILAGEVTVETRADKVKAQQLLDKVNQTTDGAHSFKAKLKRGPVRKGR